MSKVEFDGGNFPIFRSYHDVRLPPNLVGRNTSDHIQFKYAFNDFVETLKRDSGWRKWFTRPQVKAIERAIRDKGPRIEGFRWHHQDHGVMQLVLESDHSTFHYGERYITGGRPR